MQSYLAVSSHSPNDKILLQDILDVKSEASETNQVLLRVIAIWFVGPKITDHALGSQTSVMDVSCLMV